MNETTDKTTAFPCPKCENDGISSWAKLTDKNNFMCSKCGSSFQSHDSANELRKALKKD